MNSERFIKLETFINNHLIKPKAQNSSKIFEINDKELHMNLAKSLKSEVPKNQKSKFRARNLTSYHINESSAPPSTSAENDIYNFIDQKKKPDFASTLFQLIDDKNLLDSILLNPTKGHYKLFE